MSYVNKKGKTTASRLMIIRQQVSDVISYGKIITTKTKAKETQKHVEKLITLAKLGTLEAKRRIMSVILDTKTAERQKLLEKLLGIAKKYKDRQGGYTRVLNLGTRLGDNTEEAIIQFV
ncbi:MAG: 50S ribosomal protein L17 [Mycoplasmataceae bacterium]|jgi:large subunit ribosomal protein L17|nr:50S ribosomal protein L17 [Mycoplasmataceae bacterium]